MNSIKEGNIPSILIDLHQKADENAAQIHSDRLRGIEHGNIWATAYLSVSQEQGEFLYFLANAIRAKTIVEFGSSFGISTIYLAAAAKNQTGKVITSDIEDAKVKGATQNLTNADLINFVTVYKGDALETLSSVNEAIDLLFLDGAKELYLPVFNLLKPHLHPGSVIVADNADSSGAQPFNELVMSCRDQYITCYLFGGRQLLATCL